MFRFEYVTGMLIKLGIIDESDVTPFKVQARRACAHTSSSCGIIIIHNHQIFIITIHNLAERALLHLIMRDHNHDHT